MGQDNGILHALAEQLDEATGPDPRLERNICEAYAAALESLTSQTKHLTRLSMLASRAVADGNNGKTLQAAADPSWMFSLASAMEGMERSVAGSYRAEYGTAEGGT